MSVVAIGGVAGFRGFSSSLEQRADVHGDRIFAMQGAPASAGPVSQAGSVDPGGGAVPGDKGAAPAKYSLASSDQVVRSASGLATPFALLTADLPMPEALPPLPPVVAEASPAAIKNADAAFSDFFGTARKKGKDFWTAEAGGKAVAFGFTAGAAIDSDAATNVGKTKTATTKYVDVHYQSGTTVKFSHVVPVLDKNGKPVIENGKPVTKTVNRPIPANEIPYVALPPGIYMGRNRNGQHVPGTGPMGAVQVRPGDYVRVTYKGTTVYAIFADGGPKKEVGEISMYLAEALGLSDNPNSGGTDAKEVTYEILPGSGPAVPVLGKDGTFEENIPVMTPAEIQANGKKAFDEAAQKGWLPKTPPAGPVAKP